MIKDNDVFFEHILESIAFIKEYVASVSLEEFYKNVQLQDSVIRRLEIIGEAIKQVSDAVRVSYPVVDWKGFTGMRDKLIHEYFGVDINLVWEVVQRELPILEEQIKNILKS